MPPDEVEAVVSHEMGHYVEHHVLIGCALGVLGLFIALPILNWISRRLIARFGNRWGIADLSEPSALVVLLLSFSLLGFLVSPVECGVSRVIEHRADAFGLGLCRNRIAMARAFVDLAQQDLEDPYPPAWVKFWLADHPPLGERIRYVLYGRPRR
jgi:Zn-dependent protease with chaperone function